MTTEPMPIDKVAEHNRLRIAVSGTKGQIVRSLMRQASKFGVDILPIGRPELDLGKPDTVFSSFAERKPDIIVHAAAYTAVDQAETEVDAARQINIVGAQYVAAAARQLDIPIIHLSTDYVFDGTKSAPYLETDEINPQSIYGLTKAESEVVVAAETSNHVILRTSWVYSPFGKNFVRTILQAAKNRETLSVVHDQYGCPSSAMDIADGILKISRNLMSSPQKRELRGIFHMAGGGSTSWANFAKSIFAISRAAGGPAAAVRYIPSSDYPQLATRPRNSRLNCDHLLTVHRVALPEWRNAVKSCVLEILQEPNNGFVRNESNNVSKN